mgnify:CR=1 FL=1
MEHHKLFQQLYLAQQNSGAFSGHGWCNKKTTSSHILTSYSPIDERLLGTIHLCSAQDYQIILDRACVAANKWRTVPAPRRGDIIRQCALMLREKKSYLAQLVSLEMGKSLQEGLGEVQEMIDIADFAVGQSRMLYGKTMPSERECHRMYEQWHPYGIVGVISAFNFPVAVWAWNAFIAAICGNVTIWKPSSKTPLCAIAVQNICNQVLRENNCSEIFSLIIPANKQVLQLFIDDPRIALISFTGSTSVGKQVASQVARRLGKTLLELGGNNAVIVDESADLSVAIPAIVFGAIGTAGQRCTSTRRLFIHQQQWKTVLKLLNDAYAQITIGNPLSVKNNMGPLIDREAVDIFQNTISKIRETGGCILAGGNVLKEKGYYVSPTLITGLAPSDPIVQQETFVPILYLFPFTIFEEAIAQQNAVPQGLSSALFSQNLNNIELFLSAMGSDCGLANVNASTSGAEIGGAFGGEKDSGGGREAGSDAWKNYMRRQTVVINWGNQLPLAQGITFNNKD